MQRERRDAAHRHRGDHAERAEPHRTAPNSSSSAERADAAVGQHQLDRRDLPRQRASRAPCRACRCSPRPRPSGRRCRRGSRARGPRRVQLARERVQRMPAPTRARPGRVAVDPRERAEVEQRPVGQRAAVNECPEPATRTGAGPSTIACASSARVRGVAIRAGVQRTEPDQLTHSIHVQRYRPVDGRRASAGGRVAAPGGDAADRRSVRDFEWDAGRICGARHLEMGEIAAQAETIHREMPSPSCSLPGRRALRDGRERVPASRLPSSYTMTGGLVEWEACGLPLEPQDGSVAGH